MQCRRQFADVTEDIVYLLQVCRHKLEHNDYSNFEEKSAQGKQAERTTRPPET